MTAEFNISNTDNCTTLSFSGDWIIGQTLPDIDEITQQIPSSTQQLCFQTTDLQDWDALWASCLYQYYLWCQQKNIQFDKDGLPTEAIKLLDIATAVPPKTQIEPSSQNWLANLDFRPWLKKTVATATEQLNFLGEITLAFGRLITGKSQTRFSDCLYFFEQAGPKAIGIVTLISILVGMILAYLGAVQLALFGAEVYVADLVTIGMVREMGALMTAIIMAGRTGAAYAAQLGTMQTNEEIDAVTTLGISPIEFLVMPRMLALIIVMPLLCIYADVLGMLGGALVATGMDITLTQYVSQAQNAATITSVSVGVGKSLVFGLIIAIAGCKAGINSGRNSAAVGNATTKAVVSAIVWLVVADAVINILLSHLKI
jgi:phospholipid/cholesterol/gamma-HCH transport system permease protein